MDKRIFIWGQAWRAKGSEKKYVAVGATGNDYLESLYSPFGNWLAYKTTFVLLRMRQEEGDGEEVNGGQPGCEKVFSITLQVSQLPGQKVMIWWPEKVVYQL